LFDHSDLGSRFNLIPLDNPAGAAAAVYEQRLSRYEIGIVGRKEQDRSGKVAWMADAI
jgi:hypothetical protein